ncbi:MAG: hypothetical protein Q9199_001310 [Rusavskia elegans]
MSRLPLPYLAVVESRQDDSVLDRKRALQKNQGGDACWSSCVSMVELLMEYYYWDLGIVLRRSPSYLSTTSQKTSHLSSFHKTTQKKSGGYSDLDGWPTVLYEEEAEGESRDTELDNGAQIMGSPRRQVSANPRNDEPADGSVRVELDSGLCANSLKRRKCVTDSGKAALAEATSLKLRSKCAV